MNAIKHYCIFIIDFDRLGTGGHTQIKGLGLFKGSNPKPWEPNNLERDILWYNENIPSLTRPDFNPQTIWILSRHLIWWSNLDRIAEDGRDIIKGFNLKGDYIHCFHKQSF